MTVRELKDALPYNADDAEVMRDSRPKLTAKHQNMMNWILKKRNNERSI